MLDRSHQRAFFAFFFVTFGTVATTSGDTFRVKTERGTFLVEVDDPGVTVRGEGEELVVTRKGGDEVRLRLDSAQADRPPKEPLLTIRSGQKVIVSARRIGANLVPPTITGPGGKILGGRAVSSAWGLAISPDGRTLLSGHQNILRVWDMPTLTERFYAPTNTTVRRVAISPDGSTIATAEFKPVDGKSVGNVVIRDGKTGATRRVMDPVEALHCVTISPDAKVVVSSTWNDSKLRVWDVEKGTQVGTLEGHTGVVGTVVYSPDGTLLASAGDKTVRLWDVDTGLVRSIFQGHDNSVESVAFSADGKILASGGFDDSARAWDVASGKCLATVDLDDPVLCVAVNATGKAFATASARWGNGFYGAAPAQVRVWDVATGKPLAILPDQPNQIFSLLFTPDGKSLVTASLSGAVTDWDLAMFPAPSKP